MVLIATVDVGMDAPADVKDNALEVVQEDAQTDAKDAGDAVLGVMQVVRIHAPLHVVMDVVITVLVAAKIHAQPDVPVIALVDVPVFALVVVLDHVLVLAENPVQVIAILDVPDLVLLRAHPPVQEIVQDSATEQQCLKGNKGEIETMIRTYRIFIEHEIGDALSCAAYLKEGREDVLRTIITTPDITINEKMFEKYDNEYVTSYIYLEELKAQMENDYLGEIKQHCKCDWSLTYSTRELTVNVDDTGLDGDELDQLFAKNGYERLA